MTIEELMTKDPASAERSTPLSEIAKMMVDCDCGSIPILDDDKKPIGIITDRDIVCRAIAQGKNPLELTAGDCMTQEVVTCSLDMSAESCCDLLEKNQIRRAVVVDDDGRCVGMVAQADVARRSETLAAEVVQAVSQPKGDAAQVRH